jgi:hypothetical protein
MEEQHTQQGQEEKQEKKFSLFFRWVKSILLGLVAVFVFLFLLFQIPAVQSWAAQQLTSRISKAADAEVKIDYVYFSFFDKLNMKGFLLADEDQDTLIASDNLMVDFNLNPLVIFQRGLVVQGIQLKDAEVRLIHTIGDEKNRLGQVLDRIFPPKEKDPNRKKRPLPLYIDYASLQNVRFFQWNQNKGNQLEIFLTRGHFKVEKLDFANDDIVLAYAGMKGTRVKVENSSVIDSLAYIPPEGNVLPDSVAMKDTSFLKIAVHEIEFEDGFFHLDNFRKGPVRVTGPGELDYRHMRVSDVQMDIDSFQFSDEDFSFRGEANFISARSQSGFVLNKLAADEVEVGPNQVVLNGLEIITPYSQIGDTMVFNFDQYIDFENFENAVDMDGQLENASVAIRDILVFAPNLAKNEFFNNNRNEVITIDGRISGSVNDLRGRDLNIHLADDTHIEGRFSFNNLTVPNEEVLSLRLNNLETSVRTLRQILPRFNPPENFDKLGTLRFNGSFDGLLQDFVADGNLTTELGNASVEEMRMNLKEGKDNAQYSGKLVLRNFDLGSWTDNRDFGIVNLTTNIANGVGLARENIDAQLTANIETFGFKGYSYENAVIEGKLRYNLFDGSLVVRDDNVDFEFIGEINLTEGIPFYNFDAYVRKLDLKKLNLSQQDLVLSGDLNLELQNQSISDLEGEIDLQNFTIIKNQEEEYRLNSVLVTSQLDYFGNKTFKIDSEVLECHFYGIFDLDKIPNTLSYFFNKNYPGFSRKFGIKPPEKEVQPSTFDYRIRINDTKGLETLITDKLGPISNADVEGYYDGFKDSILIDISLPYLKYDQIVLEDLVLIYEAEGRAAEMDLAIDSTIIAQKYGLAPLTFISLIDGDSLLFGLNYSPFSPFSEQSFLSNSKIIDKLNLNGGLSIVDSTALKLEFDQSDLVILEEKWNIRAQNYLLIDSSYIEVENFRLNRGEKSIQLEEIAGKGIRLALQNFGFHYLDEVWDYEKLDFAGDYDIMVSINDIFEMKGLNVNALADTLWINDDDWGQFRLNASADDLKSRVESDLTITKDTRQLIAEGYLQLAPTTENPQKPEEEAMFFDYDLRLINFPLNIAEYFIAPEVRNVEGRLEADLRFFGVPKLPNIEGTIGMQNGALIIDYLKTRYTFEQAIVNVDNRIFNATGTILKDKFGHTATLYGGIIHDHLKQFGINARLRTERFLALDTKKGDNNMFYGRALGRGDIRFSGTFEQTDIYVNASVSDSTVLTIPVSSERDASNLNYLRFVNKQEERRQQMEAEQRLRDPRGLSFEMDLVVTEESQIRIVFDEQAGDIIEGSGRGNLRMLLPRGQTFQMFGNYIIEQGDYLFTLYSIVNKDFRIKRGGTVFWNGNPFGAEINIQAEYKDLNTSVANFIQEYLLNADSDLKNEATNTTDVNLLLNLQGELLEPIISFDIEFPELRGQLQTYTESKLRVLKQDQNELNKQVFGLIIAGQFLPTDFNLQGSQILYNTVSEFVSNQLSLMLTELFSEFIGDDEVLSSIDFDIAYNQYQSVDLGEGQDFNRGDELRVRLKQNFFNDRLSILVGGNIDIGNSVRATPETNGAFIGNDFVLEYALTRDRSLKLRVYQRLEPDIGSGRRFQIGTGLSFRKEFESFSDFLKSFRRTAKDTKSGT